VVYRINYQDNQNLKR